MERKKEKTKTQPDDIVQDILKTVQVLVKERDDLLNQRNAFLCEIIKTKEKNGEKPVAFLYRNPKTQQMELVKQEQMDHFLRQLLDSIEQENKPDINALWQDGDRMAIVVEGLPGY